MEWLYKTAKSKLDHIDTLLLTRKKFLCRSAFKLNGDFVSNIRDVNIGDIIHCYYAERADKVFDIGALQVISKNDHPDPTVFGALIPFTALYIVTKPDFIIKIDRNRVYEEDPVMKHYTGWAIKRVGRPVKYNAKLFPGQSTLVRL